MKVKVYRSGKWVIVDKKNVRPEECYLIPGDPICKSDSKIFQPRGIIPIKQSKIEIKPNNPKQMFLVNTYDGGAFSKELK